MKSEKEILDGLKRGREAAQAIKEHFKPRSMPHVEAERMVSLVDELALLMTGDRDKLKK